MDDKSSSIHGHEYWSEPSSITRHLTPTNWHSQGSFINLLLPKYLAGGGAQEVTGLNPTGRRSFWKGLAVSWRRLGQSGCKVTSLENLMELKAKKSKDHQENPFSSKLYGLIPICPHGAGKQRTVLYSSRQLESNYCFFNYRLVQTFFIQIISQIRRPLPIKQKY